jgi:beta-lactamase regulating signal transducer with metallopeptidase domain
MTTLVSLSLAGSVFIAVLLLLRPLYKNRLSKKWQYYVWLVVILRLMLPFSFDAFELNMTDGIVSEATGIIASVREKSHRLPKFCPLC